MTLLKKITVTYFAVYASIIFVSLLLVVNEGYSYENLVQEVNYTIFTIGLVVNVILFVRSTEKKKRNDYRSEDEILDERKKLFFYGVFWGGAYVIVSQFFLLSGVIPMLSYQLSLGIPDEVYFYFLSISISLFITHNIFYHLSLKDFGFAIPNKYTKKGKTPALSTNKYIDALIKFALFPALAGLLIGFINFLITGNFGSSSGVTIIGSLITFGSSVGNS